MTSLQHIRAEISNHPSNASLKKLGYEPLFSAHQDAKIAIIGQAPGRVAQESMIPWDDKSGQALRQWLGIDDETFYDPKQIAILPMDFYYPGKASHGDNPPRKDFAPLWHPQILQQLPNLQLTLLIGTYAQQYYLKAEQKRNLTETVRASQDYLPEYFPFVHPSPLNFRWQSKNPWFQQSTIPQLQKLVAEILGSKKP